jgi:hypothetical protein
VEFPAKDPTRGQLAQRLGRGLPRIEKDLSARQADLLKKVDSARTLGVVGLIVGGIGLLTAVAALATRRRRS